MATIDTIADRSTGSAIAGKAYFETSTNKFIVFNGTAWIELDSDGVGAVYENRWGASFDGTNDYIKPTSQLVATGAYTLSMWFKQTTNALGILAYGGTQYIEPSGSTGRVLFSGYGGMNTAVGSYTFGEWNHLMLARDSSNSVQVWLNGISAGTGSHSGNATFDRFGIYGSSTQPFGGEIDDIAYWDSDQTSNLSAIYSGGVPTDLSSLTPTGYWRMGDDSNDSATSGGSIATITDSSGNGNDMVQAIASSQPTFKALDQSTTSLSFDKTSTDGLQTPAGTFNLGNSPFTFSVWFKASSLAANYHAVFKAGSGASAATMFITSGGDVQFSDWSNVQISSGFTVTTGAWHHAAFVKSTAGSTSIDMYVDGIFRSSGSLTTSDFTGSNNTIGHIGNGGSTWPYDGEIDEFAFWDTALSASNIASLAASRGAHIINDLSLSPVAYYRMGEDDSLTDGQTGISQITDASGNGNHATQSVAANQPTASVDPVIYV